MRSSIDDLPLRISKRIVVDERSRCWIWTGGRAGKGRPYMHPDAVVAAIGTLERQARSHGWRTVADHELGALG